jgi:uncharacterized protein YjbI with pentapeptide repeats
MANKKGNRKSNYEIFIDAIRGNTEEWQNIMKRDSVIRFSNEDFSKLDLSSIFEGLRDKVQLKFAKCNLSNGIFQGSVMNNVFWENESRVINGNFKSTNINACLFKNSNLSYSNFSNSYIGQITEFTNCNLEGAKFIEATISNSIFANNICKRANMSDCEIDDVDFSNTNFENANFCGSTFRNCNFTNSKLNECTLLESRFIGCIFDGINIIDWHINSLTLFEGIKCSHLYRGRNRIPSDYTSFWGKGDFEKLMDNFINAIELFFKFSQDSSELVAQLILLKREIYNRYNGLVIDIIDVKKDGNAQVLIKIAPNTILDKNALQEIISDVTKREEIGEMAKSYTNVNLEEIPTIINNKKIAY